jgi:hypothetical protein
MIDIQNERTLSLSQDAKLDILPRRREGKRPNASTLWRWALHGIKGIRLETVMAGGVRVTSAEAIQRFFDRLTEQAEAGRPSVLSPLPNRLTVTRRKQIEMAERKLPASNHQQLRRPGA